MPDPAPLPSASGRALGRCALLVLVGAALAVGQGCAHAPPADAPPAGAEPSAAGPGAAGVAPATKRDLLRLLDAEWRAWGGQRVDFTGERPSAPRLGTLEDDDADAERRVAGYWRAVRGEAPSRACLEPWSAAFVSWAMRSAGAADFPVSAAHWVYVCELSRPADPGSARFVAHPAESYAPRPGDLVCAARAGAPIALANACDGGPTHCDVVVAVDALRGRLEAIGGNVYNSVSKSRFAIDADGRLSAGPQRRFFAVIENRMPD